MEDTYYELKMSQSERRWVAELRSPYPISLIDADPITDRMQQDKVTHLDITIENYKRSALSDRVANLKSLLIIKNTIVTTLVRDFDIGPHEVIAARLLDKKQRVRSEDYSVLNLVGKDCLDRQTSDMDNRNSGVRIFGQYFLKRKLIPKGRDLFRAQGVIPFIFSGKLVHHIEEANWFDFSFSQVSLSS